MGWIRKLERTERTYPGALIHNRTILFVDEGTSALDKENAALVEEALLACPTLTLILITHHLKEENISLYDKIYSLSYE